MPSENLVEKTDYCGIKSGKDVDKSTLFNNFYEKLETTPMIQECPVNMECKVTKTFDTPTHTFSLEISFPPTAKTQP